MHRQQGTDLKGPAGSGGVVGGSKHCLHLMVVCLGELGELRLAFELATFSVAAAFLLLATLLVVAVVLLACLQSCSSWCSASSLLEWILALLLMQLCLINSTALSQLS